VPPNRALLLTPAELAEANRARPLVGMNSLRARPIRNLFEPVQQNGIRYAATLPQKAMTPADARWDALAKGADCPFCQPRTDDTAFWIKVGALRISTLYLDRNQTYRGHCLLVFDARHAVGLESLTFDEFTPFMADFHAAARAIAAACGPDLMNYASLGNVVPHLHWHLVPRYKRDPRWGGPVYTTTREEMRHTPRTDAEYREVINAIRSQLASPVAAGGAILPGASRL
jgi:diadenosine tetraphosphate (Ap4A) HIT family hydrolase